MKGDESGYNREKSKERKREMESLERIIEEGAVREVRRAIAVNSFPRLFDSVAHFLQIAVHTPYI